MKNQNKNLIKTSTFLITGGAGFIGSNLVAFLIKNNAKKVRVLDNLSNGYYSNIEQFFDFENFEFIQGDISEYDVCEKALVGIDYVSHQAALGSVPRSIENPLKTNESNVDGFLNILYASYNAKVKNFVYAASSSTYGDSTSLPKIEGIEGKPLSPYAVTKLVNELYADVFYKTYKFKSIGLRYFNVFGPNQNPNNPYAAVIPIFCKSILKGDSIQIFGDGKTSRDFTYIDNVIDANIKSLLNYQNLNGIYNVACGENTTLLELVEMIESISNKKADLEFKIERHGDIKHSLASIDKIKKDLDYNPKIKIFEGLKRTFNHIKNNIDK